MKNLCRVPLFAALSFLVFMSHAAHAQTVVAYVLDDVWLLPDVSHPTAGPQPMTGTFQWTYDEGDFENGSGQFLEVNIPWYGTDHEALDINVDVSSTEFVLPGNFHDLGLDLTLFLMTRLALGQSAAIDTDRSKFDIQRGISHMGHVISGSVIPSTDVCPLDFNANAQSDIDDFTLFAVCMTDVNQPPPTGCDFADVDGDNDADLADFAVMQAAFGCP